MKSQPEYPIRRVAVFTGYGHPEPGPTWQRVAKAPAVTAQAEPSPVVRLQAVTRLAELQRAA